MIGHSDNILHCYSLASDADKAAGLAWYHVASDASKALHPCKDIGPAIVAALSPGLRWERNVEAARRVIGRESLDGLGVRWYRNVAKAERILAGDAIGTVLKGNKVINFCKCLTDPLCDAVCVDGHAYSIWSGNRVTLDDVPQISDRSYNSIADDYRAAAAVVSVLPMQLQAITWVVWRRIHGVVK